MPVALERAALQFQSPNFDVDVALVDGTYTLRRDIGSGRWWAVDLTVATVGDYAVRGLGTHRVEGAEALTLGVTGSAWERALTISPAGGTPTFIGTRQHGYERDDSISVKVDGVTITPTDSPTTGRRIVVTRRSTLFHPDAVDEIGTAVTTYTMTRQGLDVAWSITWSADLESGQCYGAMFPVAAVLDTGKTTSGSKVTLSSDDDSPKSASKSTTVWLWDADGNYGACMAMRDLATVFDWEHTDNQDLWLQDRSGGAFNKAYAGFEDVDIANGDEWTGRTLYMVDHYGASAATTLDF